MPRKQRSLESRIAEHERYRLQCKVRIKPSLQLCAIALFLSALILWLKPEVWSLAVLVTVLPLLFAAMEVWGYFRHGRALKELTDG